MRRLFAVTLSSLLAVPFAASAQTLPPGPGADLVQGACTNCHGLDQVTSVTHDTEGWRTTVNNMVNNGANLSDKDVDTVVDYLSAHFNSSAPAAAPAADASAAAAPAGASATTAPAGAPAATVPAGASATTPAGASVAPAPAGQAAPAPAAQAQ